MNAWTETFLGIIAVAVLAMAIVQVGVLVAAGLLLRRLGKFVDQIERDLRPIVAHVDAIGRDAARVTSLAVAQVERVDRLFADFGRRIEQALAAFQGTISTPAREGRSLLNAFRAGLSAIRELRTFARARKPRAEDDDALFI
jgi:hypothetical protein